MALLVIISLVELINHATRTQDDDFHWAVILSPIVQIVSFVSTEYIAKPFKNSDVLPYGEF